MPRAPMRNTRLWFRSGKQKNTQLQRPLRCEFAAVFFFNARFSALFSSEHADLPQVMIKRRKKARSGLDSSESRNLHERSIVLVDQRPLREAAGQEAQELLREVDRLHAALNEFDRIIQPNYDRWESQNLSSLLEEERQLEYKISELQSDIDLAEEEAFFKRADPYKIFKKAEAEREAVKAAQQENDTDRSDASAQAEAESQAQYEREAQFSEEEQAFRIYVRLSTELEPDALSEYQYSRLFEEYRAWRKKADSIKKITQKKY